MVALRSVLLAAEAPLPSSTVRSFSLKLLDLLPGPLSCGDPGLGRSLHILRVGTQEVDGVSLSCPCVQEMGGVLSGRRKKELGLGLGEGCP